MLSSVTVTFSQGLDMKTYKYRWLTGSYLLNTGTLFQVLTFSGRLQGHLCSRCSYFFERFKVKQIFLPIVFCCNLSIFSSFFAYVLFYMSFLFLCWHISLFHSDKDYNTMVDWCTPFYIFLPIEYVQYILILCDCCTSGLYTKPIGC